MDSHVSVWLRSEDSAFGALPRLKCSPNAFKGERRWLHIVFFLSFFSHYHTPTLRCGPLSWGYRLSRFWCGPLSSEYGPPPGGGKSPYHTPPHCPTF